MKKKLRRKAAVCICAAEMAFQGTFVSYGAWQTDGSQWQYSPPDAKETIKSSWYQVDGQWYWFDEKGFMKTGWHLDDDGQWYFLNPVSDGTKGKMMTGWQWIDGYCYYLSEKTEESHPLGAMYADKKTSDGWDVNKNGAWTDESGFPVHCPGKGVITTAGKAGGKITAGKNGKSQQTHMETIAITRGNGITAYETERNHENENNHKADEKDETDSIDEIDEEGEKFKKYASVSSQDMVFALESVQANQVDWKIHFTDSSDHQIQLAPSKSGSVEEGTDLTIYFQTKIVDAQNRIWKSKQKSPYVVTVTGPQDRIIYVEYEEIGKASQEDDPWKEEKEHLQACLETAKRQETAFLGSDHQDIPDLRFVAANKNDCDRRLKSAAGRIEPGQRGAFYVIGKNYIPEGSVLAKIYGGSMEYSNTVEDKVTLENDIYILSRFQLYKKPADHREERLWSAGEKRHWNVGDVQLREIDGIVFRFRCIDQNYGDEADRGRQKALFLCDTVIPADTGSFYSYEKGEDGAYGYEFYPGPVVSFGDSNSYKHSRIRKWLKSAESDFMDAAETSTGVSYAYEGCTKAGSGKELSRQDLKSSYIGNQTMTDRLFILSVDEAIKYRSWLWRFHGSEEENPETQQNSYCKSYWLRNPSAENGKEAVYVVDLIQKNIHSQRVKPEENSGDPELNATGTTGVRPAFTVEQR